MGLRIKNRHIAELAAEVARLANETKIEPIRRALEERAVRLRLGGSNPSRRGRLERLLKFRIWPSIPPAALGKVISKEDREAILGYSPDGV